MCKPFTAAGLLLSAVLSSGAMSCWAAETQPRQHDAHVHGVGTMNVAVAEGQLLIELSIPAHDLVGFEHQPKTPQQRAVLEQALARLRQGGALFLTDEKAECRLQQQDVASALLAVEASADAEHDEHDEGHAEFDLRYQFECQQPARLNTLTINLFSEFPDLEQLKVQLIGPAGQSGMVARAGHNRLVLR
ncbi:MAG: DUF2796 domain-containing protein [Pseudomonadota bacterium]|nr:DUF2796 domain-containing protein [Pseudomonadota bacterium]